MRAVIPLLTLLAVLSAVAMFRSVSKHTGPTPVPKETIKLFAEWRQKFNKLYASPTEEIHRLGVFHSQKTFVEKANLAYSKALFERDGKELSAPMFSINEFADLDQEEFLAKYTGAKVPEEPLPVYDGSLDKLPVVDSNLQQSYDVRVRHQGSCGSCWAFSAIASFEKQYSDATGQRHDLSQQELVDCDGGSNGCNGGYIHSGLNYIRGNSVATAGAYPYISARGGCRGVGKVGRIGFDIQNYGFDHGATIGGISRGKIVGVTLFAGGQFRYLNNQGDGFDASLSGECGNTINHAVNAFMQGNGWLAILNSWGTGWGNNGWKWIRPCNNNNLWGNYGSSTWAQ